MVEFIHSGDVHLGIRLRSTSFGPLKGRERRQELWHTFAKMIDYASKTRKDLLLITGDLFEESTFTKSDFVRLCNILGKHDGLEVVISPGNHDPASEVSFYSKGKWPDNVTILDGRNKNRVYFEHIDTAVWGFGISREKGRVEKELEELDLGASGSNILMLHGDVKPGGDYPLPSADKLMDLPFDYIALGHIHKPEFIQKNMAYCGSLEPLDFGETGERGFVEGMISEDSHFKFVPFSTRKFNIIKLELKEGTTTEEAMAKIESMPRGDYERDFHRIHLMGPRPESFHLETFKSDLSRRFYHLEVIDGTVPGFDFKRLEEDNKGNILGLFIESFKDDDLEDPVIKGALYSGIRAILEGSDQG